MAKLRTQRARKCKRHCKPSRFVLQRRCLSA
jgi:hypothetical protein